MPQRNAGFTLIELLVAIAVIAVLLTIMLPGLGQARERARMVVCAANIRQLAFANIGYASEHNGRYCPGAANMSGENLHRWHGVRAGVGQPFDPQRGPLVRYLGPDRRVRACPSFQDFVHGGGAFEEGNGGYGYNQAYLGRVLKKKNSFGSFRVETDLLGAQSERVRNPAQTLLFAETAFAGLAQGVIEYSFAEPRFHPEYIYARLDPSIHFRHRGQSNVAWCDGHVDPRPHTFTWTSHLYEGDPAEHRIGWFGCDDDNAYFDLE